MAKIDGASIWVLLLLKKNICVKLYSYQLDPY